MFLTFCSRRVQTLIPTHFLNFNDAICDLKLLWHALVQDQRKNSVVVVLDCPGDVFHPDFQFGMSAYFDVSVYHPLQDSLLCYLLLLLGWLSGVERLIRTIKVTAWFQIVMVD